MLTLGCQHRVNTSSQGGELCAKMLSISVWYTHIQGSTAKSSYLAYHKRTKSQLFHFEFTAMYLPSAPTLQAREHREFKDHSLSAGQLVGLAICMVLVFASVVGFISLLARHCFRGYGIYLWPRCCCVCYPADALEDAQRQNPSPSYAVATDSSGMGVVDAIQLPPNAHMVMLAASDSETDSRKSSSSNREKTLIWSALFSSNQRRIVTL